VNFVVLFHYLFVGQRYLQKRQTRPRGDQPENRLQSSGIRKFVTAPLKSCARQVVEGSHTMMRRWKWATLGQRGGMVISEGGALSMTVQLPRDGGCVVRWWLAGQCVREVSSSRC
jgi:hypothetical protein